MYFTSSHRSVLGGAESDVCVSQDDSAENVVVTQTLHYTHNPSSDVYDSDSYIATSDNTCELIAAAGEATTVVSTSTAAGTSSVSY